MKVAVQTATSVHHFGPWRDSPRYGARVAWARVTDDDRAATAVPAGLWARLRADPVRAPEYIALAAAEKHGPAAAAWARGEARPLGAADASWRAMAKRQHARYGALRGRRDRPRRLHDDRPRRRGAGWIQSRMVFFVAAAYGYDPRDPMRPAELLVLRALYPDDPRRHARRSTASAGRSPRPTGGSKLERERLRPAVAAGKAAGHAWGWSGSRAASSRSAAGMFNAVGNERSDARARRPGDPLLRRLTLG